MMIRNARYTAGGLIDLEYDHPKLGWIPFTASPDDIEPLGRELYAEALKSDDIAPMPEKTTDDLQREAKAAKIEADAVAAKADTKLVTLANMSPDEARAWANDSIKTLADAKDVIATLAVAVSVLAGRI